jgi:hypothetical protein
MIRVIAVKNGKKRAIDVISSNQEIIEGISSYQNNPDNSPKISTIYTLESVVL